MTAAAAPVTPTALQTRVSAELSERLGTYTGRLAWDADQLASHQQQRLRTLLAHAAEHSPFHRRRLGGLDPSHFQLSDLARLAVCRSAARRRFRDRVRGPRGAQPQGGAGILALVHSRGLKLPDSAPQCIESDRARSAEIERS